MHASTLPNQKFSGLNKGKITTVNLAFLLLFPGFFFYQALIGLGVMRAFLGGYFSAVAIVFTLPLAFLYLKNSKRKNGYYFPEIDFYFFIFLAYFFFTIAINYIFGANKSIVQNHVLSIIYLFTVFVIFKIADFSERQLHLMAMLSLVIMTLIIYFYSVDGAFYLRTLGESKDLESLSTYQGFARSYLFTFMVIIPFIRILAVRALIYAVAASALYLNGARTEFIAMLLIIPVIEIYYARHKLLVTLICILIAGEIFLNVQDVSHHLPDNRILELLEVSQSSSALLRQALTAQALHTIYSHPLVGDYGSYAPGLYAHNILSAWVDLGLSGFLYLVVIIGWPLSRLVTNGFFLKKKSAEFLLACSLLLVTFFLLATSHYFNDMFIGAALGAYANYKSKRK
jgi:hypothetical protein